MIFQKTFKKIGLKLITHQIMAYAKGAQTGEYGPLWQARYEFWKGKKIYTGLALIFIGVAAAVVGPPESATYIATAGGFLVSLGFVDRSYREVIPIEILNAGWYQFLARHGGLVGGTLVTASALLKAPADCSWCLAADKVVLILGLFGAQIKLMDPSWRSLPPIIDPEVLGGYLNDDAKHQ